MRRKHKHMNKQAPPEIIDEWSTYQTLRDAGLKKQANVALRLVIEKIKKNPSESIREFLLSLCETAFGKDRRNKIQQPLFISCILPILLEGLKQKSAQEILYIVKFRSHGFSKEIYNSIGDLSSEELLKTAHDSDPLHIGIINQLACNYVDDLYFGAHHLPDALIIELEHAKKILRESAEFIIKNRPLIHEDLVEEHRYYSALYQDYADWEIEDNGETFSDWCTSKGRSYHWVTRVYYEK
jgi:hypothetical protein